MLATAAYNNSELDIPLEKVTLKGQLTIPENAYGLVLFVHGSGSSRLSPRNQHVARTLQHHGIGTFLFDLLSREEEEVDEIDRHLRFDIPMLASRLSAVTHWLNTTGLSQNLPLGYFGASTGAAAALIAAVSHSKRIVAVVSRGGRPDLAMKVLNHVHSPTLFIVGGLDHDVLELNQQAFNGLTCEKKLIVVPGATHLFEEPGTLEQVAEHAAKWFEKHMHVPEHRRAGLPSSQ